MDFGQIAPFIVPAIALQLFVQIVYIFKVINNKAISKITRTKYALGILFFSLPVAAYYLLKHEQHPSESIPEKNVYPHNIRQAVFVILVVAFEIVILKIIVDYIHSSELTSLVWLSGLMLVLLIISEFSYQKAMVSFSYVLYACVGILGLLIEYALNNTNSLLLIIIISGFIINHFSVKASKQLSFLMVGLYVVIGALSQIHRSSVIDIDFMISQVYLNLIIYILILLTFYMLKKQYMMNAQLSGTLSILQQQNEMIEVLSAASERNKIAKEIHDTVGHTLTGSILSLENALTSQTHLKKDEHIKLSKDLIKTALNDIRQSVRMLVTQSTQTFDEKVVELIENIRKTKALHIEYINDNVENINHVHQHILLRAIMECSTNTIKHSDATMANILISETNNVLFFSFNDNGASKKPITMGFGLNTMKDAVTGVGGSFQVSSNDDGFLVLISIPQGKVIEEESNE